MSRCRFIPLVLLFVLTACQPALSESSAETFTPNAGVVPSLTATATASPTIEPTATFTPTPAPLVLPVTNGTPLPDLPYEVITAENIYNLRQIARYGYPRLLETNPYRLTADGKTLVVGTTLGLEFYDAQTQAKTGGFEVEFLRSFDMTPDGQYILTFAGETLTVWTRDGEKVREFDELEIGDAWELNPVALSPDGTLIAVQRKSADWQETDKVDVYRVADGSLLDTVRGNGVVFSAQYLATVFDGSVRLYPVAELGQGWETRLPKQTLPWRGATEDVSTGLAFSPDGALAAIIRPARVDVYQVTDRRLVRQVSGWETPNWYTLPMVQVGQQALLITTPTLYDKQGNVRVKRQAIAVDVASGEWLSESEVQDGFAYLEGGQVRVLARKQPGLARFLGIRDNRQLVLESENCQVVDSDLTCYWFSRDGENWRLVSEQGETVLQFKSLGEDHVKAWVFPGYIVINRVFGTGLTKTGKVHIYTSVGDEIVKTNGFVYFANAASSGDVAVMIGDMQAEIVVIKSGEKPKFLQLPFAEALMMGLSDDVLVTLGVDEILFRNLDNFSKTEGLPWVNIPMDINAWVSLSPNGEVFLFSAGTLQRGIGVIDLTSAPMLTYLMQEVGLVKDLHFSPDGRLLATYGADGFIRVWGVPENVP